MRWFAGAALVEADARTSEQHLSDLGERAGDPAGAAPGHGRHWDWRESIPALDVHRDEVLRAFGARHVEQLTEKALEEYSLTVDDLVAEYGPEQMIPGRGRGAPRVRS